MFSTKHFMRNEVTRLHLASFLALVFFTSTVFASANTNDEQQQANLNLRSIAGDIVLHDAAALSTNYSISVNGPIIQTRVKQVFQNQTEAWLEGLYTFPLPAGASVDALRMQVGELTIEGQIKEKQAARKIYNEARESGKRSVLLEKPKGNLFKTNIANIAPNATITVEFSYQQLLPFKDHGYELRVPLVATPQYDPMAARGREPIVSDADRIVYREPDEPSGNPVKLEVMLNAGFDLERVHSPSHFIHQDQSSPKQVSVRADVSSAHADRDFVLRWRYASAVKPKTALFTEQFGGDVYNLLMVLPPAPEVPIDSEARELILVLDVSGSMAGESLRQAKSALSEALLSLRPQDYFNIVFFNNAPWSLFEVAQPANTTSVRRAQRYLDELEANGGTEIISAIDLSLSKQLSSKRMRQVVFMTDGAVANEDQALLHVSNKLGRSRLFTVGIGSAPNNYFMELAAEQGKGTYTYIGNLSEVNRKIHNLLEKLRFPAATDLQIDLDTALRDMQPSVLPDIYRNEAGYVLFKTNRLPSALNLEAKLEGMPRVLHQGPIDVVPAKGLAKEWARRKIHELALAVRSTSARTNDTLKQLATDLAIEHHLVSRFTSLIAVDVTPVRIAEEIYASKTRSNLPKGWRASGDAQAAELYLAQTATNAPWLTLAGLIWMLIACALFIFSRLFGWLVDRRVVGK